MLSGIGLCDELIIRPEESYRLWCVVCVLETTQILVNEEEAKALWRLSRQEKKEKQSVYIKKLFLCSEHSTNCTYLEPHECSPHVATINVKFNIITFSMRRFLVIILNPLVYFYVGRPVVDNICGEFDDQVSIYEFFKNGYGYRYIMTEQKALNCRLGSKK